MSSTQAVSRSAAGMGIKSHICAFCVPLGTKERLRKMLRYQLAPFPTDLTQRLQVRARERKKKTGVQGEREGEMREGCRRSFPRGDYWKRCAKPVLVMPARSSCFPLTRGPHGLLGALQVLAHHVLLCVVYCGWILVFVSNSSARKRARVATAGRRHRLPTCDVCREAESKASRRRSERCQKYKRRSVTREKARLRNQSPPQSHCYKRYCRSPCSDCDGLADAR